MDGRTDGWTDKMKGVCGETDRDRERVCEVMDG